VFSTVTCNFYSNSHSSEGVSKTVAQDAMMVSWSGHWPELQFHYL